MVNFECPTEASVHYVSQEIIQLTLILEHGHCSLSTLEEMRAITKVFKDLGMVLARSLEFDIFPAQLSYKYAFT